MKAIAVMILLTSAVAVGAYLGTLYLRGDARKPALVALHLLLGAIGLEAMVMLLFRGTPSGDILTAAPMAKTAAGLLVAALCSGLMAPLLGRNSKMTADIILATHVTLGMAGFGLLWVWVTG
jgi:hypothetical protein